MPDEAVKTKRARQKIIQLYKNLGFHVTEEEIFPTLNNMGDFKLDYKADIVVRKTFIIELDPPGLHDTHRHTVKDEWRNKNIFNEYQIKTVRLEPNDIMKQDPLDILIEVDDQLITFKQRHNLA